MANWWDKYKIGQEMPEFDHEGLKVEHFTISEDSAKFDMLRSAFGGYGSRAVRPGNYTRLSVDGCLWMSDTPAEIGDHMELFREVRGAARRVDSHGEDEVKILIHGCGLGVATKGCIMTCAEEGKTAKLTIVEVEPRVIATTGAYWQERYPGQIEMVEGDALEWKPPRGETWHIAWHDIWPMICLDNKDEMSRMHRRFGRRVEWQSSWARPEIERMKREENRRWYW